MRNKMVVGNWKMNLMEAEAIALVDSLVKSESNFNNDCEVVLIPSFLYLKDALRITFTSKRMKIGAQNCHSSNQGAFTGEVSASMIASIGAHYILIGHSERRKYFSESDSFLAEKVKAALAARVSIIFCVGETLEERNASKQFEIVDQQLLELFELSESDFKQIVIAYEPVWAIGTGLTATSVQAQEMHAYIRLRIKEKVGAATAEGLRILYGGSCTSSNSKEIFSMKDVDGGLIGGASLKSEEFIRIIQNCA